MPSPVSQPAGEEPSASPSRELAERFGVDYSDTFCQILNILLQPEEMALLLATPDDTAGIARRAGREERDVGSALYDLYMRGLVYITTHIEGQPVWNLTDSGRLMDCVLFDPRYDQYGDEFFDLWRQFFNQDMVVHEPPQQSLRVLPVEEVIRSTRILDIDSARGIIRNARRAALQRCPCRTRERRCDNPLDVCLSFDGLADYVLSRELGREITKQEALQILERCEDLGLVHQTVNSDRPDVICNCCPCCCSLLRSIVFHGIRAASASSRFRPAVNDDLCVHCLACTEACHFSAMVDDGGQRTFVAQNCFGCGLCAHACPEEAIQLVEVLPPEHIPAGPGFNPSYVPPLRSEP
jgi:electron transport complex protein RnfB